MEDFQKRVVEEKEELDEKLSKLGAFLSSDHAVKVDNDELERLRKQADIMKQYSDILSERIAAF